MDKLKLMLEKQKGLQERLNAFPDLSDEKATTKFIRDNIIYTIDELSELMREIPFNKGWKDYSDFDRHKHAINAKVEYIDAFHFFMNIGLALGMDADMIFNTYMDKNKENHARQDRGYGFSDSQCMPEAAKGGLMPATEVGNLYANDTVIATNTHIMPLTNDELLASGAISILTGGLK